MRKIESLGLVHRIWFKLTNRKAFRSCARVFYFRAFGAKIGRDTRIAKCRITWPNQLQIGNKCEIDEGVYFRFDGIWNPGPSIVIGDNVTINSFCEFNISDKITIGNDSLIASGCKFIDHNHIFRNAEGAIRNQSCVKAEIKIGTDVWLGSNVIVLKGVEVGDGAIVAAGAVLNRSIPSMEVWGGVPARKIGERNL